MAEQRERLRVLIVKPGLDGHWRGAMVVSMALRDAGMEVIYGGNETPQEIAETAIQEDVDVVGLSIYAAGHLRLITEVIRCLKEKKVEDILLVVGGIIPQVDIPTLKEAGVAEVFLPGTPLGQIVDYLERNAPKKAKPPDSSR